MATSFSVGHRLPLGGPAGGMAHENYYPHQTPAALVRGGLSSASPASAGHRRAARRRRQDIGEEELEEIREAFALFDTDNDGRLEYRELKVALRALGFAVKKAEVLALMKEYDRNAVGKIDAEQFKDIGTRAPPAPAPAPRDARARRD